MKFRILSIILLAFCLMVPSFAQDKMGKMDKKAPKMAKQAKSHKAAKTAKTAKVAKTSASGKMKDLGNGVFQDSKGRYRDASGKFMAKKDAEAKLGKKSGPARDAKGRFIKKGGKTAAPKVAKKGPKAAKK